MPKLHQLRASGSIENDADSVTILHRERDPKTGVFVSGKPAQWSVAKQRNGPTGTFSMTFTPSGFVNREQDGGAADGAAAKAPTKREPKSSATKDAPPQGLYDDWDTTAPEVASVGAVSPKDLDPEDAIKIDNVLLKLSSTVSFRELVVICDKGYGWPAGVTTKCVAMAVKAGKVREEGAGDGRLIVRLAEPSPEAQERAALIAAGMVSAKPIDGSTVVEIYELCGRELRATLPDIERYVRVAEREGWLELRTIDGKNTYWRLER